MKRLAALGLLLFVSGCVSLEYYAQAVGGHLEVMRLAVPIEERLREADTPEPLRAKLSKVLAIREFASRELGLPDNDSYRRYAISAGPVVWNVFAALNFGKPVESCLFSPGA
jgi:predicted aminopeptidase